VIKERKKIDYLRLLLILIVFLAIVLGILQIKWNKQFLQLNEDQHRLNIENNASQIMDSTRIEIDILFSILFLTKDEIEKNDFSRFSHDLDIWNKNSTFSDLLESIHLLNINNSDSSYKMSEWDSINKIFSPVIIPDQIKEMVKSFLDNDREQFQQIETKMNSTGQYIKKMALSDIKTITNTQDNFQLQDIFIYQLNKEIIYNEIIPFFIDKYLMGYPFSITENSTNEVLLVKGDILKSQKPEFSIQIQESPNYQNISSLNTNTRFEKELSKDLFIRMWISLIKENQSSTQLQNNKFNLNIYYPGGDLSSQSKVKEITNLVIIIGFLILVTMTLFLLYFLNQKSRQFVIKKQNFVSSMSHELRTPIAVLQSVSDTLCRNIIKDPERIAKYNSIISKQSKRLSESVEGILLYSGLEDQILSTIKKRQIDLSKAVLEIVETMKILIIEKQSKLILNIAPGIKVNTNTEAIRLILENLISNAIKHGLPYKKEGNNTGTISINLGLDIDKSYALLSVIDRGPGIPVLEQKKIFNPFFRCKHSIENQSPGSGLGLNLVKKTVDLIEGDITIKSPLSNGKTGSNFTVKIPYNRENK